MPFDPRQRRPKPVTPYAKDLSTITHTWDRETGADIEPEWLRTYAEVLRTYPVHSESKFLDGGRTRRGATRRRHVLADLVWNIGKEGDRFEEDGSLGAEDDPAVPYGLTPAHRTAAIEAVRHAKARFGVRALRKAAGVSDNTIKRALEPGGDVGDRVLAKMRNGAARLWVDQSKRVADDAALLTRMRDRATTIGVSALAVELGIDASNLAKVLAGKRAIGEPHRS